MARLCGNAEGAKPAEAMPQHVKAKPFLRWADPV
jgi:hypothetical protein